MASYQYPGLEPWGGCAGCEWFRRTVIGEKEKERVRPYCLARTKVVNLVERPACWEPPKM